MTGVEMMRTGGRDARDEAGRGTRGVTRRGLVASLAAATAAPLLAGCSLLPGAGPTEEAEAPRFQLATVFDSEPASTSATLMMVGDMLIHTSVWKSGARPDGTYNYDHFFANLADEFSGADISMVNQETILGGTEHGLEDFPYFNSPQELGDAEVKAGVDVAVSATNHALDHGFDGICWTLDYWHGTHPEVVVPGIAATEEEALEPKVVERNGIKVAIVSYTEITNLLSPPADKRWCLNILRDADIAADVARAREAGADIVVACPHWGTEYVYRPDDAQPRWASDFVDAGVDAIIGTHPHVLQPVELLEGPDGRRVPVFWSLGNFVSSQIEKPRMVGGMAKLTFEKGPEGARVTGYSLTPLVTHRALGTDMSVYRLSDYTEELAARNYVRNAEGCGDFTAAYCRDLASQILGEGYDPEACVLTGTL